MTDVFVLRNQHNEFLTKSTEWLAAGDSKTLYRSAHRDEVINEKVEVTVKRPDLRIKVVKAEQASNGKILIDGKECIPKAQDSVTPAQQEQAPLQQEVKLEQDYATNINSSAAAEITN